MRPLRPRVKRFLPRTLLARVLLILLLPVVLAQLVATYVFFDRHWENLTSRLAYGVAGDVALAVATLQEGPLSQETRARLALIERHTDLRLRLEPDGALPSHSDTRGMINAALDRSLALRLAEGTFAITDRAAERLRDVHVKTPAGILHVTIPQRRLSSSTAPIFLLWMTGSALLFFGIAALFMRNQIRPIRRLAHAAELFGKGQDVAGFKPEGALEVRRAAQAFLVMRERIRRQIRQRTEMLAGVSHDLRTPLTRMKLQLALMKPQEGFDELRTDIADMEQMVEGYLAFARGADGEPSLPADLVSLLEGVVADANRQGDPAVTLKAPAACVLTLRPQALRRCLGNLVGNALRYGTTVQVSLEEAETAVFVHVDDDGPGIPADRRGDVLRPFVRLEDSRNPDTGGVGLGLTIASDIAKGHGGDLTLATSPAGGLRATVRLPR